MKTSYMSREIGVKFTLIGATGSGRRTALQGYQRLAPPRGKVTWIDSVHNAIHDGAAFVDFIAPNLVIRGFGVRIEVHVTLPPCGPAAFALALNDLDGVIFIADSTDREANIVALERAAKSGFPPPAAYLLNKRDLPNIATVEELKADLGIGEAPAIEGIATKEVGIFAVLKPVLVSLLKS